MIDLIVNPIAGNGYSKKVAAKIIDYLENKKIEYRVYFTQYKRHATQIAKNSVNNNIKTVFSIGGDGTAFEVADGLLNSNTALGVIPAGTGNDFIKSLNLPSDPLEAFIHMLSIPARPLDIGLANENVFLNVCGTGFEVMVIDFAEKAKKFAKGLIPYFWGVFCAIFHHKPYKLKVTLDSNEIIEGEYLLCTVANGMYFGGGIPIAPKAKVDDGFFDVILIDNVPNFTIPFYLYGLMTKKILNFKETHFYHAKNVVIEGEKMRVNEDGEVYSLNKVSFTNLESSLLVHW